MGQLYIKFFGWAIFQLEDISFSPTIAPNNQPHQKVHRPGDKDPQQRPLVGLRHKDDRADEAGEKTDAADNYSPLKRG